MNELWYSESYTRHLKLSFRVKDLIFRKKTKYQRLDIIDTYQFGKAMLLDGRIMFTEKDEFIYHEMMVHPAVLLHPSPKAVLVIGGGDGGVVRELVKYKGIEKIVVVDIDEEVILASQKYFSSLSEGFKDERVEIKIEDGAFFVENSKEKFDIVIVDSTDPVGPGPIGPAKTLISQEFMQGVSRICRKPFIYIAQTESPTYKIDFIKKYRKNLGEICKVVKTYFITVPSFGGLWSITYGSDSIIPDVVSKSPSFKLKYYTPEIHSHSFAFGEHFIKLYSQE